MVCPGPLPRVSKHGQGRIDGVDALRAFGEADRQLARAAAQVEQNARTGRKQAFQDLEDLARVGWPGRIRPRNARVRELLAVLGGEVAGLLFQGDLAGAGFRTDPKAAR
jgi:hypothetical protein